MKDIIQQQMEQAISRNTGNSFGITEAVKACVEVTKEQMVGFHCYMKSEGWLYSHEKNDWFQFDGYKMNRNTIEGIIELYLSKAKQD